MPEISTAIRSAAQLAAPIARLNQWANGPSRMGRCQIAVAVCMGIAMVLTIGCGDGADTDQSNHSTPTASLRPIDARSENPAADDLRPAKQLLAEALAAGRLDQARPLIEKALIESPDDPKVYLDAAMVMGRSGNADAAADFMHDAVNASPTVNNAIVNRAISADMAAGRINEPIEWLETVVKRDPDNHSIRRTLVGLLGEAARPHDAQPHLIELIKARKFDANLMEAFTDSRHNFATAVADELHKRRPNDFRMLLGKAIYLCNDRNYDDAIEVLLKIIEHHPNNSRAWARYSRALAETNQFEKLDSTKERWPESIADHGDFWAAMGIAWLESPYVSVTQHRNDGKRNTTVEDPSVEKDASEEEDRDDVEAARFQLAANAFARAIELEPNDALVLTRMSRVCALIAKNDSNEQSQSDESVNELQQIAEQTGSRASAILNIVSNLRRFAKSDRHQPEESFMMAKELQRIGRTWEAEAWSAISLATNNAKTKDQVKLSSNQLVELQSLRTEIGKTLVRDRRWQARDKQIQLGRAFANPTYAVSSSTTDAKTRLKTSSKQRVLAPLGESAAIRLADQTKDYGLDFFGHTGSRREGPIVPLSASFGCGGGVIDFDLDGNSDLFLAAAGDHIRQGGNDSNSLWRLTRDSHGNRFHDVTGFAGLQEDEFGQGVAVGDYNNDGFPDIYVLNFGNNRLFQNKGDGTFQDVTDQSGLADRPRWSSSGAIADLNNDGLADLIALNYADYQSEVDGDCLDDDGNVDICYPMHFAAAKNQYFLGQPDGTFLDVSDAWTAELRPGRSLGLIVGRLTSKRMGVFIANDMSENQLHVFPNEVNDRGPTGSPESSSSPAIRQHAPLDNLAMTSGVAVDGNSNAQASMGIATSDFDGDGRLDLYVTGTSSEHNVLYKQSVGGLFLDQTKSASLVQPTLRRVAFGSKAIDFDNDGLDELIVTNGNISELGGNHPPYAQPLDLFRVSSDGRWQSVAINQSPYFDKPHVGRALFTIDANGDKRSDVVITHMTEPVSLLINETPTENKSISFELIGRNCQRDAVGATVSFEVRSESAGSDQDRTLYRLAGNGYLCSAEAVLRAGTGTATEVRNVVIQWPNGNRQQIERLESGQQYLVVEGEAPMRRE